MKNILSYQPGTKFTGREIIDWAIYQIEEITSHYRQGKYIIKHYNISPEHEYIIQSSYETAGCGEIRRLPKLIRYDGAVGIKSETHPDL